MTIVHATMVVPYGPFARRKIPFAGAGLCLCGTISAVALSGEPWKAVKNIVAYNDGFSFYASSPKDATERS